MSEPSRKLSGTLSHIGPDGRARMVDVGGKPETERVAVAEGFVRVSAALEEAIRGNTLAKGNLLEVARLAGIQAAKRTDELIPLCHSLPLDAVDVRATLEPGRVRLRAEARTHARTGVEMEALVAVSVAALTVIDMGKAVDKGMIVEGVRLLEKRGGRSGHYVADTGAGGHAEGAS
jgi:cyclic pyranopterin phosphate synthase